MPYTMEKVDGFSVKSPHGTKAKHTSKAKAEAQMNLLRGIESGWKPTGKRKMSASAKYRKSKRKK